MKSEGCFSEKEARDYLGIGRTVMYQLARRPDFPSVRVGRRILIPKAALDEWLSRQAQKGTADASTARNA